MYYYFLNVQCTCVKNFRSQITLLEAEDVTPVKTCTQCVGCCWCERWWHCGVSSLAEVPVPSRSPWSGWPRRQRGSGCFTSHNRCYWPVLGWALVDFNLALKLDPHLKPSHWHSCRSCVSINIMPILECVGWWHIVRRPWQIFFFCQFNSLNNIIEQVLK